MSAITRPGCIEKEISKQVRSLVRKTLFGMIGKRDRGLTLDDKDYLMAMNAVNEYVPLSHTDSDEELEIGFFAAVDDRWVHYTEFYCEVSCLSTDAQFMVNVICSMPPELVSMNKGEISKRSVERLFKGMGWDDLRVQATCDEITAMLHGSTTTRRHINRNKKVLRSLKKLYNGNNGNGNGNGNNGHGGLH